MARYTIRLTQHLSAIIEYTRLRSAEETTASLRDFLENQLSDRDKTFKDFKKDTEYRIDIAKKKHGESVEYLDRVDQDLSLFKNYCDDMKLSEISQLFSQHLKANDLKNDNEHEYTPDIKNYDRIDRTRFRDVVTFGQTSEEDDLERAQ